MKLVLDNCGIFKQLVDATKDLVQDVIFKVNQDKLEFQAMDTAHVSLCYVKLTRDIFDSYEIQQPTEMGVSLTNLSKILKCASNEDRLTITRPNEDLMSLVIENFQKKTRLTFNMKLMHLDNEELHVPDKDYHFKLSLQTSEFKKIITDMHPIGDTCSISINKNILKFSVDGDIGKFDYELELENVKSNGVITQDFSTKYLKTFTNGCSLSKNMYLFMQQDEPFLIVIGPVRYYLAAKIYD